MVHLSIYLLQIIGLFLSYRFNLFFVCPHSWFEHFQSDSDQLVWLKFSISEPLIQLQGLCSDSFCIDSIHCVCLTPYWSCAGSQVLLLQLINQVIPLTLEKALSCQAMLTAVMTVLCLQLLPSTMQCKMFLFACLSPWWIVIAKSIYWQVWLWLLILYLSYWLIWCWHHSSRFLWLGLAVSLMLVSIFRCLSGYEFYWNMVCSALLLGYILLKMHPHRIKMISVFFLAGILVISFVIAVCIHSIHRSGNFYDGFSAIVLDASKRCYDIPEIGPGYEKSRHQNRWQIIMRYHLFWEHSWLPWIEHGWPCLSSSTTQQLGQLLLEAKGNSLLVIHRLWKYQHLLENHSLFIDLLKSSSHGILFVIIIIFTLISFYRAKTIIPWFKFFLLAYGSSMGWLILMKNHAALHAHLDPITWWLPCFPLMVIGWISLKSNKS